MLLLLRLRKSPFFTYPGLHFVFALGTPLWQSRNTLHEWKDNSVHAKSLAACTHLSLVSQLFEPQVQKNCRFHVSQPTFLFPLETALRLSRNMFHGWKDNSMLAKPLAACTYVSSLHMGQMKVWIQVLQLASRLNLKYLRKCAGLYSCYFYHIFVSPWDTPGAIT